MSTVAWPSGRISIRGRLVTALALTAVLVAPASVSPAETRALSATSSATSASIAVVGDFGVNNAAEASVASMVAGWGPDAVLATGDDYYAGVGGTGTGKYGLSVGKYYCAFLKGAAPGTNCPSGGSAATNSFGSSTGNHDYDDGGGSVSLGNYLDYFAFPSNERYYAVTIGPVDVFVLDSQAMLNSATELATEKAWLESVARASTASWQVAVFHHPPYSSSSHGSNASMQWPFASWGIDLVLNGHDHTYERVAANGITYVVDGFGGAGLYSFGTTVAGSVVRYNGNHGALKLAATTTSLTGQAYSIDAGGTVRDTFSVAKVAPSTVSLTWSGGTWAVKTSPSPMGPGPNLFGAKNAWVDASGSLHLAIARDANGAWNSGEVIAPSSLGYGTYTFTLGSRVDNLDPNAVLGLFTWSDTPDYANREIDIEFARWGDAADPTNAQYVVQPYAPANHLVRFTQVADSPTTHSFTWSPGKVAWESRSSSGALTSSHAYEGGDVPVPGDERVHLNLWLDGGAAPLNGTGAEVIVRSFSFTPPAGPSAPGAFGKAGPRSGAKVGSPVTLSWNAATGATSYEWCLSRTPGTCDTSWTTTSARTAATPVLTRRTRYYWQVRAVNAGGMTDANAGTWWPFTTK